MAEALTPTMIFMALLGGVLPALIWLRFWLSEDRLHPEPRGHIILAFMAGMVATVLALPLERMVASAFGGDLQRFILWATIEEVLKFLAFIAVVVKSRELDEPIDAVMYFITVALGFAALENAMFLFNSLERGDMLSTFILGNYRFIGATVLHVASSGLPGVALGLAFWKSRRMRSLWVAIGLLVAIVLHTLFNYFIFMDSGVHIYGIFSMMWVCALAILLLCEKIKRNAPSFAPTSSTHDTPLHTSTSL